MTPPPVPQWLADARDAWVVKWHLMHTLPDLYDWAGVRGFGPLGAARDALCHHLRHHAAPHGLRASWPEIAACVGALSHSSVLAASRRFEKRNPCRPVCALPGEGAMV